MDARMFRSFSRTAMELQSDADTPPEYTLIKAAVEAKYGIVKEAASNQANKEEMYRRAFQSPEQKARNFNKLAWNTGELAGLGILATPAASNLAGRPMPERGKDVAEVTGLGMLAAPYAHNIASGRSARYANSGIGQKLTRVFKNAH